MPFPGRPNSSTSKHIDPAYRRGGPRWPGAMCNGDGRRESSRPRAARRDARQVSAARTVGACAAFNEYDAAFKRGKCTSRLGDVRPTGRGGRHHRDPDGRGGRARSVRVLDGKTGGQTCGQTNAYDLTPSGACACGRRTRRRWLRGDHYVAQGSAAVRSVARL